MSNFIVSNTELQSVSKHIQVGKSPIWNSNQINNTRVGDLSNLQNGYVLTWDDTSSTWIAQEGGGITNPLTEDLDLGDNNIVNIRNIEFVDDDQPHATIVYLPALVADFNTNTPAKNVIVTLTSAGNVRPLIDTDPISQPIIGVTHTELLADGSLAIQIGGIIELTPGDGVIVNPGNVLEHDKNPSHLRGTVTNGISGPGNFAQALTGGTGNTDGTVKILALFLKNESF